MLKTRNFLIDILLLVGIAHMCIHNFHSRKKFCDIQSFKYGFKVF